MDSGQNLDDDAQICVRSSILGKLLSVYSSLSDNESRELILQIFHIPERMVSSELGVPIVESVASNNMKQAKGRIWTYENNDIRDSGNATSGRLRHSCVLVQGRRIQGN